MVVKYNFQAQNCTLENLTLWIWVSGMNWQIYVD